MKQLLTEEQVMDLLQISNTTLAEYRTEGMPFKKASKRVLRYDAEQVSASLQRRKLLIQQRKRQATRWRPRLSLPFICRRVLSDQVAKPY